ncbi:MAG: Hsp20/alpha crystallin family protein [Pseudomonadota bacterium]
MNPFRGDALKDLTSLQERMNRIFTESVKRLKEMAEPEAEKPWTLPVDIFELGDSFVLLAEVPGIPKDKITVEVQGGSLVIRGERPLAEGVAGGSLFRSERYYGPFERTFNLPVNFSLERIQAKVSEGVLVIKIAKPNKDAVRVSVNIE